jgi:hypothetical protein
VIKENRTMDYEDDVVITLERTACNGTCPVYKLTIYGDGRCLYEGERFVRVMGIRTFTIPKDRLGRLISFFEEIGFSSFNDSYEEDLVPDMATAITCITVNGNTKNVRHHYGDLTAPKELTRLEHMIDKTVNSRRWVK